MLDGYCSSCKREKEKEDKIWICRNCGHVYIGTKALEVCHECKHYKSFMEVKVDNYE